MIILAIIVIFFATTMIAQFVGGAKLFEAVTGYSYVMGLAIFGIAVILFTTVGVFRGVAQGFAAMRYHSLAVDRATLPDCLEITAEAEDGEIMGGYGQNIAAFYGDTDMRVHCHGISKAFHTEFKAEELLDAHGISVEKLTAEIIGALK